MKIQLREPRLCPACGGPMFFEAPAHKYYCPRFQCELGNVWLDERTVDIINSVITKKVNAEKEKIDRLEERIEFLKIGEGKDY